MPLPPSQPRTHLHTRNVVFRGYLREDGLWDIEAQMRDTKTYDFDIPGEGVWPPGSAIHDMTIRVTVDDALVVREIAADMASVPHPECPQAQAPMQKMIGATMGRGWRQAIEQHLGSVRGCTHLRELLFNMATAAYQTIPSGMALREPSSSSDTLPKADGDQPPMHLGKCMTWDFNGPTVERHYPMFFQRDPKARAVLPPADGPTR